MKNIEDMNAEELEALAAMKRRQETLLQVYNLLREAESKRWEAARLLKHPSVYMTNISEAINKAQLEIAKELGAEERVCTLVAAGMDKDDASAATMYLLTNQHTAQTLATWLFDMCGRAVNHQCGVKTIPHTTDYFLIKQAEEHCPLGVQYWREGNHDT
jgi:hypothetical protein